MSSRRSPLLELTLARWREFVREPGVVFWVFGFPLGLVLILGLAFREQPPQPVTVGLADALAVAAAGSTPPGPWIAALEADEGLVVKRLADGAIDEALRRGDVDVVVSELSADGALVYRYDPSRPTSRSARLAVDDVVQRAAGRTDALATVDDTDVEAGDRYVDFLFPGMLGLNLMGTSMWGIGYSLVLNRKQKLLKRLAVTPMRRTDYLLAMCLSRLVFLALEVAVLLVFGALVFGVKTHGSLAAVIVLALVGAACFAAISLVIAARVKSIEVATGWMNVVMLPMWLLSGSFFAYTRFPDAAHPFIRALPLTALNDGLRSVMNEGASLASTVPQLLVLAAWGVVSFLIAHRTFRWQ